jgi:hypothetical protein
MSTNKNRCTNLFATMNKNTFASWQHEDINTFHYGTLSIHELLHIFLDDGIIPFIQKNGYTFLSSKTDIGDNLATLLFHLDFDRQYIYSSSGNNNYKSELFNNYIYYPEWENFWKSWNNSTDDFFVDAEMKIQLLIWSCIDINKSKTCQDYLEDSDGDEDERMKKLKNMDPYLLDQLNASNHYKFTRFENS